MIQIPVLPGFHPDPSALRVGDNYYIATSTFEWMPGVRLHHSRDLTNWTPIGHVLTGPSAPDLRGIDASGGVQAPNLSYELASGTFYVVFSIMRNTTGDLFDVNN